MEIENNGRHPAFGPIAISNCIEDALKLVQSFMEDEYKGKLCQWITATEEAVDWNAVSSWHDKLKQLWIGTFLASNQANVRTALEQIRSINQSRLTSAWKVPRLSQEAAGCEPALTAHDAACETASYFYSFFDDVLNSDRQDFHLNGWMFQLLHELDDLQKIRAELQIERVALKTNPASVNAFYQSQFDLLRSPRPIKQDDPFSCFSTDQDIPLVLPNSSMVLVTINQVESILSQATSSGSQSAKAISKWSKHWGDPIRPRRGNSPAAWEFSIVSEWLIQNEKVKEAELPIIPPPHASKRKPNTSRRI